MNDLNVRRWTGAFGVASIALILVAQPHHRSELAVSAEPVSRRWRSIDS